MDVFLCTMPGMSVLRDYMADLCIFRWRKEDGDIDILNPDGHGVFQIERRIQSDQQSRSDIYVCADDDCFLGPEPFLAKAEAIMRSHPDFGILSPWPANCNIQPWRPADDYKVFEDDDVMEHHSVGGIRVCRKGIIKDWPAMNGQGYDTVHCAEIRRLGYRVGLFKTIRYIHLGEGYTTVWKP